jgi:hypothetical protein
MRGRNRITLLRDLRAWLAEIAEEQFQRHRRWLRGLKPEQEQTIRAQLLPSVIARLALACTQEGLLCELPGEDVRPLPTASGAARPTRDQSWRS